MTSCHSHTLDHSPMKEAASTSIGLAAGFGALGTSGLLLIYFGLLTAVSGWSFTLDQFDEFWPYIIALAVGFGIQVGLFTYLHRTLHAAASGKVVAASGTTSGVAMLACCTHYLVTLLPALGATGLVMLVSQYQIPLFWVGLASNLAGILYIGSRLFSLIRPAAMVAALLALVVVAVPVDALAQTGSLAPQVNKEGQVTVKVTPLALAGDAWRFEVQFDTHVVTLDHDPVSNAVLVAAGHEEKPLSWQGDPPGGHHRKGVLVFKPVSPQPPSVTVKIRNVGPVAERSFTWNLGAH